MKLLEYEDLQTLYALLSVAAPIPTRNQVEPLLLSIPRAPTYISSAGKGLNFSVRLFRKYTYN